ncbi:hypothetical protein BHE74_00000297 [Ensete ventricosum]|nr:hypothetical protein BHE74_00000297 [Ensete ventricosum]
MLQGHTHEYRVAKLERLRKARQARKNRAPHRQAWWEAKKASDANKVAAQVITSDEHGVDYQKLIGHLKSTNPALVALVEAITTTTSMNLDAVMRAPMRIPLTRQPITIPL